ncbi:hypothetical protein TcCL_ESM09156 [Trypanosoma cruzi]|nr:hypothetical protein TcCL_ESM09156 [Trypanosoma cruzi]
MHEAKGYRCVQKSLSTEFSSCSGSPHQLLRRILRIPQSHSPICKVLFTIPGLDPIQGTLNGSRVCNELIRIEDVTWNRPHFIHASFDYPPLFRLPIRSPIAPHPRTHRLYIRPVGAIRNDSLGF